MNNCIFFRQIMMKMSPKKNSCHFNQMTAVSCELSQTYSVNSITYPETITLTLL